MFKQKEFDPMVNKIVKELTAPRIPTVRKIADEVEKETGVKPSTSSVYNALKRLGYVRDEDGK